MHKLRKQDLYASIQEHERRLCDGGDAHFFSDCLQKASTTVSGPCQSLEELQSSLPPGNATDAQLQAVINKAPPSDRYSALNVNVL